MTGDLAPPVAAVGVLVFWASVLALGYRIVGGWLRARRRAEAPTPPAERPLTPIIIATSADALRWRRALEAIRRACPHTVADDIARDALYPRPSPDGAPRGLQRSAPR